LKRVDWPNWKWVRLSSARRGCRAGGEGRTKCVVYMSILLARRCFSFIAFVVAAWCVLSCEIIASHHSVIFSSVVQSIVVDVSLVLRALVINAVCAWLPAAHGSLSSQFAFLPLFVLFVISFIFSHIFPSLSQSTATAIISAFLILLLNRLLDFLGVVRLPFRSSWAREFGSGSVQNKTFEARCSSRKINFSSVETGKSIRLSNTPVSGPTCTVPRRWSIWPSRSTGSSTWSTTNTTPLHASDRPPSTPACDPMPRITVSFPSPSS
jgi:hypothetical protein